MASFLLLAFNFGKLVELDGHQFFLNLDAVRQEYFILFVLIYFIDRMPETEYRMKVVGWLKFFLFIFSAGAIANRTGSKVGGPRSEQA